MAAVSDVIMETTSQAIILMGSVIMGALSDVIMETTS